MQRSQMGSRHEYWTTPPCVAIVAPFRDVRSHPALTISVGTGKTHPVRSIIRRHETHDLDSGSCWGRRFVRWSIPIASWRASIAGRSSPLPQASRSSTHSEASLKRPSGVPSAAPCARRSEARRQVVAATPRHRQARRTATRTAVAVVVATLSVGPGRCSPLPARTAARPPRCRSSPPVHDRCTAATASRATADLVTRDRPVRTFHDRPKSAIRLSS